MRFSNDVMWKATVDCDSKYDGKFFYAVKTVGVFCRPSCKSRTPLRKNVVFFAQTEEAQKAGFRPCKRCRPDISDYAPVLEIAKKTKAAIDDYYIQRQRLSEKMKQIGAAPNHLAMIFKKHYGMTPLQYINRLKIEKAQKLLEKTDMPIIDIALEIEFNSISAFYHFFKKNTGLTPKEYRIKTQANKVKGL